VRRLVVVVLVVAVVVSSLGFVALRLVDLLDGSPEDDPAGQADPGPPPPTESGSAEPPRRALAAYYDQELSWQACGDHECARLEVPLDYAEPRGRTIELALLRVPATGERRASLVVNPGGPGSPGTEYAAQAVNVFRPPLRQHYDVVGFDPRGTGRSAPVDCLTDAELDRYLATDPTPDTAAERADLVAGFARFGRGCVEDDAALAAHVSTIEAARDMDVLRAALGQGRLDYFGASYGTKLGATYAELFPRRVGRLVLDGAVDVSLSSRRLSLEQARGFETALRAYVTDCVENVDGCFLGDSVEGGLDRIAAFLEEVDAQPLPTSADRDLTVGLAFYGIVTPLYNRDNWYVLSAALRAGFGGEGDVLLNLADLYASRGPGGYTDNSSEAFPAISCLDDPYAVAPDQVPAQLPAFRRASPSFGDVFAWGLVGCSGQVAESTEEPVTIDGSGADPIVVIGTTRDPATPYEWAEALADQLDSGVLVSRDGDGHTGYNAGNECVDRAVEAYLLRGEVPEDGLSC
jgi:pimeloyl-ACP methyl ester carboxylesterase